MKMISENEVVTEVIDNNIDSKNDDTEKLPKSLFD